MAPDCASFHTALEWYATRLAAKRRFPAAEAQRQVRWIRQFSECLPKQVGPTEVSVRDVVLYFAEQCDNFGEPVEWYYRYKALESFFEELTREFSLASNQIRGLYDDSDLEPELLERMTQRHRFAPVNWSREERYAY